MSDSDSTLKGVESEAVESIGGSSDCETEVEVETEYRRAGSFEDSEYEVEGGEVFTEEQWKQRQLGTATNVFTEEDLRQCKLDAEQKRQRQFGVELFTEELRRQHQLGSVGDLVFLGGAIGEHWKPPQQGDAVFTAGAEERWRPRDLEPLVYADPEEAWRPRQQGAAAEGSADDAEKQRRQRDLEPEAEAEASSPSPTPPPPPYDSSAWSYRAFEFIRLGDWEAHDLNIRLKFIAKFCEQPLFEQVLSIDEEFYNLIEFLLKIMGTADRVNEEANACPLGENDIRVHCFTSLINLARKPSTSSRILDHPTFLLHMIPYWFEQENLAISRLALPLLNNLAHDFFNAQKLIRAHPEFVTQSVLLMTGMDSIQSMSYENHASFLCNATQTTQGRKILMDPETGLVSHLFLFLDHTQFSPDSRIGVSGSLKNCCMVADCHEWLLGPDVDILAALLLPLAGEDEFTDEENQKLPLDLQYLPADKTREPIPAVRHTLLQALMLLCARRKNRETIRDHNAYIILRQYHLWETVSMLIQYTEDLVNILIRTEDEIGMDDIGVIPLDDLNNLS